MNNQTEQDSASVASVLASPLELPCGIRLKNRIVKSAMSDSLGDGAGNATEAQARLYERWAEGGVALSLIGEVQPSPFYPEKPGNLVLAPGMDLRRLKDLASRGSAHGTHIWPQIGHAGALAHAPISLPRGPSALDVEGLKCDGMTPDDIAALPELYAMAARQAIEAGFGGVQIHAGHGFLLSQFLSPLFNRRADSYGGAVAARFRIIGEILDAVRHTLGPRVPIGIKINSTDKLEGGLSETEGLEVIHLLDQTSVDLIDISGGTYFPGAPSSSEGTSSSGPYFLDFAKRAKTLTRRPIMLTGGIRRHDEAVAVLRDQAADAVSLARALALNPAVAQSWVTDAPVDPAFPKFESPPPGGITAWYTMRLTAIGEDRDDTFDLTLPEAIEAYETRDADKCHIWQKRFS